MLPEAEKKIYAAIVRLERMQNERNDEFKELAQKLKTHDFSRIEAKAEAF